MAAGTVCRRAAPPLLSVPPACGPDDTPLPLSAAPWCSHCTQLKPHFEEAAASLEKLVPGVVMAQVDGTASTDLAAEYSLKSYPTLKWFTNGEASDYTGQRSSSQIVSWVQRHTLGSVSELVDAAELEALKTEHNIVVVGFFGEREGPGYSAFNEAAMDSLSVPYKVVIASADKKEVCGTEKVPSVVLYKQFDEGRAVHFGNFAAAAEEYVFSKAGIEGFVKLEAMQVIQSP